jgi:predicted nuclease of predicted toxin-antitoxin system
MGEPTEGQLVLDLPGSIPFLVDEDVPASVARYLSERGHAVTHSREQLGRQTPDEFVARLGDQNAMVVVTCNAKDFKSLSSRRPSKGFAKFRHVGLLTLECGQVRALQRVQQVIESIEFEYAACQRRSDRRFFMEVRASSFVIQR